MKRNFLELKKEIYDLKIKILKLQNPPKFKIGDFVKLNSDNYIKNYYSNCTKEIIDLIRKESKFKNQIIIKDIIQEVYICYDDSIVIYNKYDLIDININEIYYGESEDIIILLKDKSLENK